MSTTAYRVFIDGLVQISESVGSRRVLRGFWHPEPPPDQVKFNELLQALPQEQRAVLAELLQKERTGAIHDVLCYIQENEYKLTAPSNESFSESPFGTDLHFDYVARLAGDPWPSSK